MERLILASASPRRRDILTMLGLPFTVMETDIDETPIPGASPAEEALRLATEKMKTALFRLGNAEGAWILGADTVIDLDGSLLGKSETEEEARSTLRSLAGRDHEVITALALRSGKTGEFSFRVNVTRVEFAEISEREIDWYLGTGEWRGVAGSYRVQERAAVFVSSIEGSPSSVAGLPIRDFYAMLADAGFGFP